MPWFKTINHRGEEVDIASVDNMNAVVDAYEERMNQLKLLLEGSSRDQRRAAADEVRLMLGRADEIEAAVRKANAHAELESEDDYHRRLAQAIGARTRP